MTPEAPIRLQGGRFVVILSCLVEPMPSRISEKMPSGIQISWVQYLLRGHEILKILVEQLQYQGGARILMELRIIRQQLYRTDIRFGRYGHLDISETLNHG